MSGLFRHGIVALIAFAFAAPAVHAQTRPLEVEDVVSLEAFGRASISPDGRWAVYEKEAAYDTAPRFDYGNRSTWAISDLWLVDLSREDPDPERLLPGEEAGLLRAVWSPSGERLVVWRFRDDRLEIGIVTVADRSVVWTGLTPEIPLAGADTAWVEETRVVLTVRPDGSLPAILRYYGASQSRVSEAWERSRLGRDPARTVIESQGGMATTETPEPKQALILLDVQTGGQRVLAEGRILDFALSPDGRRIAIMEGGPPVPLDGGDLLQAQAAWRQRLALLELDDGGRTRPSDGLDIAPHLLSWSPDSREVLVWARPDGAPWEAGGIHRVGDAGAGSAVMTGLSVGTGAQILRGVRAGWMGSTPVVRARASESERWDWYGLSRAGPPIALTDAMTAAPTQIAAVNGPVLLMFADGGLWATSLSGSLRLTLGDRTLRGWKEPDPDRVMRLTVNTPPMRDWVVGLEAAESPVIVNAEGEITIVRIRPDPAARTLAVGRKATLTLRRRGLGEVLALVRGDAVHDLDQVNAGLSDVELTQPIPIDHDDAFGRPVRSWLFLPRGGAAGARGLIVEVYPGAVDSGGWYGPARLTYGFRAAVAAGAGFAVLSPAIPVDRPDAVGAIYYTTSVDLAVDAALAARPDLPSDRMAVLGHSFGGHAALGIASRSRRYRSYVIGSAPVDLFGEWGEFIPATRSLPEDGFTMVNQQGWVEAGQGAVGALPWEDPQAFIERSPYLDVDRITAPLLLLTADRDYVPMSQMERIFSARYRLGGDARLVTYWGEHHHVLSPANIRDRYAEIFRWLDRSLAP